LLATVGLVGAFLGALFWGTISDYIGRRTSFQATVGIFALFTGLVAVSWNVLSLGSSVSCPISVSAAKSRSRSP
jgi:MFS family permease